jgi:hypothetical protein
MNLPTIVLQDDNYIRFDLDDGTGVLIPGWAELQEFIEATRDLQLPAMDAVAAWMAKNDASPALLWNSPSARLAYAAATY